MVYRTYGETRHALEQGETTCEAVVSAFLEVIRKDNAHLNIFLSVDEEEALERARVLDQEIQQGKFRPLTGLVLGVKDVISIKGKQLTCASRMLEHFESLYDAAAIERLREAGAIFIGKLNCDEFAMGSSNENSYFGPVRNPVNPEYVPGGSSGGSAAAVAAGMCHAALGTDTGGSIRLPAAFCGVVGLKPTYGRVSRRGLVAFASSFDVMGPLAANVEDTARILQVMAGKDEWDSTSAPVEVPDYLQEAKHTLEGLRVGLPEEYYAEGLDPEIRALLEQQVEHLQAQGAEVVSVHLPHTSYGIATYYILTTAEASSNLARYDGVRYGYRADVKKIRQELAEEKRKLEQALEQARKAGDTARVEALTRALENQDSVLVRMYKQTRTEGFGTEVKRRIMLGTYVLSAGYYEAYYGKAQRVRTLIRRDFEQAFEQVDVLLTPASATTAFKLGEKTEDPLSMYLTDIYTVPASLAGIPGLVLPVGTHSNGLPIGMQLLAPHFEEARLFQVGMAIEKALVS